MSEINRKPIDLSTVLDEATTLSLQKIIIFIPISGNHDHVFDEYPCGVF